MVDHSNARDDLVAEHLPQLLVRIAAMGAGGDEHGDVPQRDDALELLEDGRDDDAARLGSRAVTDAQRDRLARLNQLPQRRPGDWIAEGGADSSVLIGRSFLVRRRDDCRPLGRQVDGQTPAPVGELDRQCTVSHG
jgi:hypothetical protein